MAAVTKENEENEADASDEGRAEKPYKKKPKGRDDSDPVEKDEVRSLDVARQTEPRTGPGLFTIYKSGQGYWTRMGTLLAVGVLGLMLAYTLWNQIPSSFFPNDAATGRQVGIWVAVGFILIYGFISLRLMNKPSNVDFLIATDSEMKKVNWTSKKELIGSSKVVIFFMFLIAIILFILDMYFTRVFYLLGVLVSDSPMWDYVGALA